MSSISKPTVLCLLYPVTLATVYEQHYCPVTARVRPQLSLQAISNACSDLPRKNCAHIQKEGHLATSFYCVLCQLCVHVCVSVRMCICMCVCVRACVHVYMCVHVIRAHSQTEIHLINKQLWAYPTYIARTCTCTVQPPLSYHFPQSQSVQLPLP